MITYGRLTTEVETIVWFLLFNKFTSQQPNDKLRKKKTPRGDVAAILDTFIHNKMIKK